ncbi:TPA: extracellular solute-binding protein [Vibrio parahaemolyticus]|nr:extracellular solute-binding protein [Vibrio parahaemolyticus]
MSRMTKTPLVMLISGMLLGTSAYAEDKLTVVSWGGAFTKSQVEAYHKPFIQKTGVEIVSEDFSGGLAEIKAQVEANNVRWDLVSLDKPDEVYRLLETEEGRARAFAKLDTIKPQVLWWTTGAQPPQMLADKEVVIASAFNGRIHNARKDEGQPFRIIWDHQMGYMNGWAIPKGSANTKLALDFIAFSSGTKPLADQAKYVAYGPTRKSSSAEVSSEILANLPTAPQNFKTAFLINDEWWSDYADELNEEFNTWLLN